MSRASKVTQYVRSSFSQPEIGLTRIRTHLHEIASEPSTLLLDYPAIPEYTDIMQLNMREQQTG